MAFGQRMSPLRGVNLGGWLVLEKWMTPAVFEGLKAIDEYSLCRELGAAATKRLAAHRDTFITEADFVWLATHGVQAVRLPVGYWLFGSADDAPYIGTSRYVDMAFDWAEKHGLKILLDLHGAPGSQNGRDHSGHQGETRWAKDRPTINRTLAVIKQIAERYGKRPGLLGIELLNEPSVALPKRYLKRYYQAAYAHIRQQSAGVWVVFNPYSMAWRWTRELREPDYRHVLADVHSYQCFSKSDKRRRLAGHLHKLLGKAARGLRRIRQGHQLIIGEWSLTLNQQSLRGLSPRQLPAAYRTYGNAQLLAYQDAAAWFYWSYKMATGGPWSFRHCVEQGWLPDFTKASACGQAD